MPQENPDQRAEKTPTGIKIPGRRRSDVMKDFAKVAGPLRGQNQDRKPKS
jgi:hypothetical protein